MEYGMMDHLPQVLLPWFDQNKRDLPWRQDREPYHVWLSEIMLQQTRVEAVKGYYSRLLSELPTIESLALCDDDTLLKLWEGLGYYSRVRNLKKAAQRIRADHDGLFPREYDAVRALPGIGDYTAGAICSICYDMPKAAVDGNVLRVISRLTADDTPVDMPSYKTAVRDMLEGVYPSSRAGDFTQALMELGATVCVPNGEPRCDSCPCRDFCSAYQQNKVTDFPVRLPKKGRRVEEMTVFILRCEDKFALQKRPAEGLLASMWQFPNVPGILDASAAMEIAQKMMMHPKELLRQSDKKHIFTHIQWNMRGYYLEVGIPSDEYSWMCAEEIRTSTALPTAFRQFWEGVEDV